MTDQTPTPTEPPVPLETEPCPGSLRAPGMRSAINGQPAGYCNECGRWRLYADSDTSVLCEHVRFIKRVDAVPDPETVVSSNDPKLQDSPISVDHGAIESVLGTDPPRLLMRYPSGERYEIEFDDRDVTVQYTPPSGMSVMVGAGWLVDELTALIRVRQNRDEHRQAGEHETAQTQAVRGHLSHTTVPADSTVTTAHGRLKVADFASVDVVRPFSTTDSGGRFVVLAHGFDYEDHRPRALWLQLLPVVTAEDPNGWVGAPEAKPMRDGGWLAEDAMTDAMASVPPTPPGAGWLAGPTTVETGTLSMSEAQRMVAEGHGFLHDPPPGHDEYERREARAAVRVLRQLIAEGSIEFDVDQDRFVATDNDRYAIDNDDDGSVYALLDNLTHEVERDEREARAEAPYSYDETMRRIRGEFPAVDSVEPAPAADPQNGPTEPVFPPAADVED